MAAQAKMSMASERIVRWGGGEGRQAKQGRKPECIKDGDEQEEDIEEGEARLPGLIEPQDQSFLCEESDQLHGFFFSNNSSNTFCSTLSGVMMSNRAVARSFSPLAVKVAVASSKMSFPALITPTAVGHPGNVFQVMGGNDHDGGVFL